MAWHDASSATHGCYSSSSDGHNYALVSLSGINSFHASSSSGTQFASIILDRLQKVLLPSSSFECIVSIVASSFLLLGLEITADKGCSQHVTFHAWTRLRYRCN
jgi:hypothetical protein